MSDTLPDPTDAPPLSAGRSSHGDTQGPEPIPAELKTRLDKIIYSEVCIGKNTLN